jgi:hypothetical protein
MKKVAFIAAALLFSIGYTANAQMGQQNNNQSQQQGMMMQKSGMMQGGMMQGMMGNDMCPMCGQMMSQNMPMKKYGTMVNHLPNMQDQLSLSDVQVETLIDLQTEFKKQQIESQAELRKKQMKLKNLLADNASASQIRSQMQACSDTKISMKMAAYETAGQMKAVLNSDQKEQLKNNMMQSGGMMQGGMMKEGMMQGKGGMMNKNRSGMMQNSGGMMQNQNNQ